MEYFVFLKNPFAKSEVVRQLASQLSSWSIYPFSWVAQFPVSPLITKPFSLTQAWKGTGGFGPRKPPRFENADVALYDKSGRGGTQIDYYDFGAGQVLVADRRTKFSYWQWKAPATKEGITQQDLVDAAKDLGLEPEVMMAIARQESHGGGFFKDGQPKILFERHKMYAHLKKEGHDAAALAKANPDIVDPKQGGYGKESIQYDKLKRARALDEEAALQSASWGRFQIMGENYRDLYKTPQEMETAMRASEKQQLAFFVAFLRKKGGGKLIQALKDHKWETVAFYYNGKYWKKINPNYATNIQKYYEEFKKKPH
jgi:hypothetical protein